MYDPVRGRDWFLLLNYLLTLNPSGILRKKILILPALFGRHAYLNLSKHSFIFISNFIINLNLKWNYYPPRKLELSAH
jgi:hypothetical protein